MHNGRKGTNKISYTQKFMQKFTNYRFFLRIVT